MKQTSPEAEGGTPPDSLNVTLVYTIQGEEHPFTREIVLPHTLDPKLIPIAVTETFVEIEKDVHFSDFYEQMPDPMFLGKHAERKYTQAEWYGEQRMFDSNTEQVWYEISNTLLSAKYSLAQSRAYKDVELSILKEVEDRATEEVLDVHLSKMNAFDVAVYRLAKIEDLFLLLLFVNLGNSLVDTNVNSIGWEKQIVWRLVKEGLQKRHPKAVSNRYLNQLSDSDYARVWAIFNRLKSPNDVRDIIAYRDATTHRIPPSVDYTGLSGVLVFSPGSQTDSTIATESFVRHFKVDYKFLDLYEKAVNMFKHYVQMLQELKAVSRFA